MKNIYLIIILFSYSFLAFSQDQIVFVRLDKYWQMADMEGNILGDKEFDFLWTSYFNISPPSSNKSIVYRPKENMIRYKPKGYRAGYMNSKGETIIKPDYHHVANFSEGLAVVAYHDYYFYINKEAQDVFEKTYSEAGDFSGGMTWVKDGLKYRVIDTSGQFISEKSFTKAKNPSQGFMLV